MPIRTRLLGLAFAASDLLIEMDADGVVVFALGSGPETGAPGETLVGRPLSDVLGKASVLEVRDALVGLAPGRRSGAIEILMTCSGNRVRRASARLFQLPDLAPNISCAIQYEGPAYRLHDPAARPALSPIALLERARQVLTDPADERGLAVAFVDINGLSAASESGEAGQRLVARVEAALQSASLDGSSAGRLSPERFAMLRDRDDTTDLIGEVRELGLSEGLDLTPRSAEASIEHDGNPLNALRALRFAVEGCLADGGLVRPEMSFTASLARTLKEADAFRAMVRTRNFELHYQPIVALRSGAVHHFEALARFKGTSGPAETIHMAEELALIEGFDLAVAEKALGRLRRPGAGLLKFAVNVSGASLADDRYVQALLRMTAANPDERRRLIVEVTESAALADIGAANRRLGALRSAGIKVCIDDFGAGAASYDYLHGLSVDTVKIDGRFVQGLDSDPRGRTMIGHLVEMCGALGVETIAEMIETQAVADILRELGVDHGQGWLFGKAELEPRTTLASSVEPARRRGAVTAWA
jgi:EAL domain-containing protein (putative c-di-GMP-specific phosphodiesterase class I)